MKKSKAILMVVCAMLLVAASVMGTLAYLTSQASVTNTFSVGKVAITMDEAKVDEYGESVQNADGKVARVDKNTYKLVPGHTYTKDPIIHVATGSEDCYLFVKVVNAITAIEGATTVANQMAAKGWICIDETNGIYYYGSTSTTGITKVQAGADVPVFDTFTVASTVDNDTLEDYAGETIVVTAYAIQADGFENNTPGEIWAARGM